MRYREQEALPVAWRAQPGAGSLCRRGALATRVGEVGRSAPPPLARGRAAIAAASLSLPCNYYFLLAPESRRQAPLAPPDAACAAGPGWPQSVRLLSRSGGRPVTVAHGYPAGTPPGLVQLWARRAGVAT